MLKLQLTMYTYYAQKNQIFSFNAITKDIYSITGIIAPFNLKLICLLTLHIPCIGDCCVHCFVFDIYYPNILCRIGSLLVLQTFGWIDIGFKSNTDF